MAVRIDLFSIRSRPTFVGSDPESLAALAAAGSGNGDPNWLGFIAAADADESEFVALLEACAGEAVLVGAVNGGLGLADTTAVACAAVEPSSPLARIWLDVIGWAAEAAEVQRRQLGWLTRYDQAGSRDAGAEEWSTSWSDAPTEGTAADTPWPEPSDG